MKLTDLSNAALLDGLKELCGNERRVVARIVAYLIEVEDRRLHLEDACSSLFDFCVRKLGMSEGEAFRRITAARIGSRFPSILGRIERGEVHLSALVLLRDHLTEENHEGLLDAVAGKSKRGVEELLAARFPRPDVPSLIQKLPARAEQSAQSSLPTAPETLGQALPTSRTPERFESRPTQVVEPLSAERYKVQVTASAELRAKLQRATELMRHRNPSGDLAVVIERALDLLVEKLEKERLGKTSRLRSPPAKASTPTPPSSKPTSSSTSTSTSKRITRAARREVVARDNEQCAFVSDSGDCCPARGFLEVDHVHPQALGGTGDPSNLRLLCRAHNQLAAERAFGRAHIQRQIHFRQRKSKASVAATPSSSDPKLAETVFEVAQRALIRMGFHPRDVEAALNQLNTQGAFDTYVAKTPTLERLLRAALSLLSSDTTVTRYRAPSPHAPMPM